MDRGVDHPVAGGAAAAPPGGAPAGMEPSGGVPFGHAPPGPPSGGVPFGSTPSGGAPAGGVPLGRKPAGGSPSGRVPFGANPCSGFPPGGCISVLFPADDEPLAVGGDPWGATVAGLDSLDGLSMQPAMQMQQASSPPTAMANRATRRFLSPPGVVVFISSLSWLPDRGRRAVMGPLISSGRPGNSCHSSLLLGTYRVLSPFLSLLHLLQRSVWTF